MTNENNSFLKIREKEVEFFLSKKRNWHLNQVKLFENELLSYNALINQSRKNEFLGIRFLRNSSNHDFEICYQASGKPFFNNSSLHISISHSKNFVALAVSTHPIGIDIEECHERILKIRDRFLNAEEKKIFDLKSLYDLTVAWCIKESLFKLNSENKINIQHEDVQLDHRKR